VTLALWTELCITICCTSRPCMFADLLIVFECIFSRTELL